MAVVVVVVGRGPGHQFVHPMKRGKRDKQQLAVLTALSQLALCDDEVDVVVVRRRCLIKRTTKGQWPRILIIISLTLIV